MSDKEIAPLIAAMERRLEDTSCEHHRPLYSTLDWNDRLVCIKGAKGTGKTTMMLQFLKEHPEELDRSIYISLDSLWFANHSPLDVADWLHNNGGRRLFIDEVHHFKPWQTLIKNLADDYPKLQIVYSGSSMMKLNAGAGDLSRRQRPYELKGLSFREYLEFEGLGSFPVIRLTELLKEHRKVARSVVAKMSVMHHFHKYLKSGYYPFYKTARGGYHDRLSQVVVQTLVTLVLRVFVPISSLALVPLKLAVDRGAVESEQFADFTRRVPRLAQSLDHHAVFFADAAVVARLSGLGGFLPFDLLLGLAALLGFF